MLRIDAEQAAQRDGRLKQDADILFVLTTNRPEQLESALAGRPGRIDQAIEIPLPDADGREKLLRLYGRGMTLGDGALHAAVRRTEGVSAAFIKELCRRAAQANLSRDGGGEIGAEDFDAALNEMLFDGGGSIWRCSAARARGGGAPLSRCAARTRVAKWGEARVVAGLARANCKVRSARVFRLRRIHDERGGRHPRRHCQRSEAIQSQNNIESMCCSGLLRCARNDGPMA